MLGGLPTPRTPSERRGACVVRKDGRDVTAEYRRGAECALETARREGVLAAVLNALNAKVRSLNARSLPEGNALVYVTTEVPDLASLRLIMARIRTLGGVREIARGNG